MSSVASKLRQVRRALASGDHPTAYRRIKHLVRTPLAPAVSVALGEVMLDLGHPVDAQPILAGIIHGDDPAVTTQARALLAKAYNQQAMPHEALAALHPLIGAQCERAEVWHQTGWAFLELADRPQALTALRHAVHLDPAHGEAWLRLGSVLAADGHPDHAAHAVLRAEAALPDHPLPCVRLGFLYFNGGRLDEARAAFGRALERAPGHAPAVAGLAMIDERAGDLEASIERVDRLAATPTPHPLIAAAMGTACRRRGQPERGLPAVNRALEGSLSPEDRSLLLHTRGDLLDALGRVDEAFAAYASANQERRLAFNAEAHLDAVQQLIAQFPRGGFDDLPTSGLVDPAPVLIVGMPRSGTSLVEHILASHPAVAAAGELEDWRKLAIATSAKGKLPGIWYAHLDGLTPELLQLIGDNYLARLHAVGGPSALRVTDKMPSNVLHLGLVALACPGARVIHCVRDPRDVGWSCFRQRFHDGLAYATDLTSIGLYHRSVDTLMEHWKGVLPLPVHTVTYEALVHDLPGHARALCEFVDLPFDEACLRPHEQDRHVPTASYAEVSEPVHTASIGRWRAYQRHLGPLLQALGR